MDFFRQNLFLKQFYARSVFLLFVFLCAAPAFAQDSSGTDSRAAMISYSKRYIGTPYRYGGIDSSGMDCSGFLYAVASESIGLQLPRTVDALYGMSRIIGDSQREPGDILFFKTVGSKISHAGLYLGNDQFIHSASDGPNTGVIVSSLKESYWKQTYAGAGQILPPAKTAVSDSGPAGSPSRSSSSTLPSFFSHIDVDATLTADWTLFSTKRFMLLSRGAQLTLHASYTDWQLHPGIGVGFGWDAATGAFNVPLIVTVSMSNGIRVYAGPVFSFGKTALPETDTPIAPSIFPGVIGAAWSAPPLKIGDARLSFVQDIHYQVYNNKDGAALTFFDSASAGLVFSTGIRVNLSANDVFK